MAEQEFTDLERQALLGSLEQVIGLTVPSTTKAFLWLADLEVLERWVQQSRAESFPGSNRQLLVGFENFNRVIAKWQQKDRRDSTPTTPVSATPRSTSQASTPSSHASTSLPGSAKRKQGDLGREISRKNRSSQASKACRQRDKGRCIISRDSEHDVAHIYPWSLRGQDDMSGGQEDSIWAALQYFWSKDRIEAWHKAIFPEGSFIEACHNLLCLSPSAHRYHAKGYFALQPIAISGDQKCLTVKFFWLRKGQNAPFVNLCESPSLESHDQGPGNARLINHETPELIRSGDEIQLTTEDPQKWPLPNWHLLEMQWFLNRVVAMSGAADVEDDYDDEDENGLMQEDDFNRFRDIDSEDEQQSSYADSPPSSLPSAFSNPSSTLRKAAIQSQPVSQKSVATDQSTVYAEQSIQE